jgi:hypothetical protein
MLEPKKTVAGAPCTWSDGPDVLVTVDIGNTFLLAQVAANRYSFGLTVFGAKMLMNELNAAIHEAEEAERAFLAAHSADDSL